MVAPAGSPVTLKVTLPVFPVRARVTAVLALEPSGTVSVEVESWSVLAARGVTGAVPSLPPQPMNESERQRTGRSGTRFFTGRAPLGKSLDKSSRKRLLCILFLRLARCQQSGYFGTFASGQ